MSLYQTTQTDLENTKSKDNTLLYYLQEIRRWLGKYFCEGQVLSEKVKAIDDDSPWYVRNRRLIGMAIPFCFFHIIWWSYMISADEFHVFTDKGGSEQIPLWYMSITMIFGSMVAGATSEGGGAIAFPVMTLLFGIKPSVARDFSFMIQSAGMTSASFTILWMGVKKEAHSLVYCTLGGIVGIIFGLEEIAPTLEPAESKMYFVVIWFAFAFALFWLNRLHGRKVFDEIPYWEQGVIYEYKGLTLNWKACALFTFGIVGGIFSSIAGSGIDICSFSCLTLLFRVSEKIATPTSVVLMGINTLIGFLYRNYAMGGVEPDAWEYLKVCVPFVVAFAPLGSVLGSYCHRLVLASFIYVLDTAQLIGALYVIQPWTHLKTDNPTELSITSAVIVLSGAIGFAILAKIGEKLLDYEERDGVIKSNNDLEMTDNTQKI